jgi:uncharacterized protein YhfF
MTDNLEMFWNEFLESNPHIPHDTAFQTWYLGSSRDQAIELAQLVISGTKTATASLLETNLRQPDKAPIDGGYSVVTSFEGEPMCVVQTTEIRQLPFCEVDAAFAYDEGEDNRTLQSWRAGHWAYFTREADELGFEFNENSIVCCERFRLLFPV